MRQKDLQTRNLELSPVEDASKTVLVADPKNVSAQTLSVSFGSSPKPHFFNDLLASESPTPPLPRPIAKHGGLCIRRSEQTLMELHSMWHPINKTNPPNGFPRRVLAEPVFQNSKPSSIKRNKRICRVFQHQGWANSFFQWRQAKPFLMSAVFWGWAVGSWTLTDKIGNSVQDDSLATYNCFTTPSITPSSQDFMT